MFSSIMYLLFSVIIYIFHLKSCATEMMLQPPPSLYLYSPGELEFTDVVVKRTGDNLTLACELRGDAAPVYVWNYVPHNASLAERPYTIERNGSVSSRLLRQSLTAADSGQYVCSAPPFSVAKYILVQEPSSMSCAHGAFTCGSRCVLPAYVCDGRRDCLLGEDEAPEMCTAAPCARTDRLNCSSGRCIPAAACCPRPHALCRQPACCDDHPPHARLVDVDMPPVFDDRHAPDDYGFIQSTIYTVTACALIFMIAVVLLVSAICKMHMKRCALRSYHARHYSLHYAQRHRFPPCYEASGLLDARDPLASPVRDTQCGVSPASGGSVPGSPSPSERRTRLAALTHVFTSRYRQVPTQCTEVEMTAVASPAASSPAHSLEYRSPTGALPSEGAPHLNAQPPPSRLTLQLGRFQLSIPRFGRAETRPDTPNVAEINIDDLDFVRLNSNETYTLNGRTIRLLGGNFENYPPLSHGSHPPPYNEAMRYKLYGPPPEYLSRDRLNRSSSVDEEARSNIEMPPCYDELSGNNDNGNGNNGNDVNGACSLNNNPIVMNRNLIIMSNILETVCNDAASNRCSFSSIGEACGGNDASINDVASTSSLNNVVVSEINDNNDMNLIKSQSSDILKETSINNNNVINDTLNNDNGNVETLNSVIDNLPAIDSDVNANDGVVASC